MRLNHLFVVLAGLLFSCNLVADFSMEEWKQRVSEENGIDNLGRLYIEFLLQEDPTQSSSLGIHGKAGNPYYYDRLLPTVTAEEIIENQEGRRFLLNKLNGFDENDLTRPDQIDRHILTLRVTFDQFQAERLGVYVNPLNGATALGEAMSGLVLRDYAPLDDRLQSFGARCAATGEFLDQVKNMLSPATVKPTEMEKTVTLQRLGGLTSEGGLYDKTLPQLLAGSGLEDEAQAAILASCVAAVEEINGYAAWFDETIGPRENSDWRLGRELYDEKYALQLDYPLDPTSLLAVADGWMTLKSNELVTTGREIHDAYLAEEIRQGKIRKAAELDDQQVVRDIFTKLSEDRSTTETLIADSYALADSIIGFVEEENLMDLPPASKLRIEPIPPHLAGNTVAQIQTAPPFEPELESVWFWDLEFLAGAEDFLKEYNRPALAVVYIHEGVPGHFVQLEYSNRSDRIIPKVFWNGPMVEGWAAYIVNQMVDAGFTVYPDDPWGHQLQQMVDDKMSLRSVINAIIDIRLHRTHWPEEDAVKMMMEQGFQEESEARGKLVRAKLSSVQLASYFAGQLAIENILAEYKALQGDAFSWKEFNERLVGAGSPPFFAIREYMLAE
ncbi:MAG TPA: DUF885 domain-containing protein [Xanthomonadales bacterium]|nr:DUF885 domain-containing protein [Xanthomonadales bacterium]